MKVYLGLGSNIGNRIEYLEKAKELLNHNETKIIQESSIIETKPFGYLDQPDFMNQVIIIETTLSANSLFDLCQAIEQALDREREIHWGPRTIDIDILFYENKIINTSQLTVPHKGIPERLFVLESLVEIAPDLVHPILKKTIKTIYNERKQCEN